MAYQVIINLCKLLSIYCSISPERSPNLNVHLCQYGNLDVDLRRRLTLDAGALRELCRRPLLVFYLRLPRCLLFSATRQQGVREMQGEMQGEMSTARFGDNCFCAAQYQ